MPRKPRQLSRELEEFRLKNQNKLDVYHRDTGKYMFSFNGAENVMKIVRETDAPIRIYRCSLPNQERRLDGQNIRYETPKQRVLA